MRVFWAQFSWTVQLEPSQQGSYTKESLAKNKVLIQHLKDKAMDSLVEVL